MGYKPNNIPYVAPLNGTASLLISSPDGTGWIPASIIDEAISASVYVVETIETSGNIEGNGAPEDRVRLKNNISLTSVTSSFKGNLNGTAATASYVATGSAIETFTNDVRKQISGSQYVSYNTGSGVIALPYTGSVIGNTSVILGQTVTTLDGLSSISSSVGYFTTLTASNFNLGNLTALTTSTGDLTVNNLTVNGVIENAAGAIQYITGSGYQIIPSTSLVKISAPSGSITLNTGFPTIKTTGYNEGTRVFIVNVGASTVSFKDDGAVSGTKLKMASQTYNQATWGCIQFVLVSGSIGKAWIEAGRGA